MSNIDFIYKRKSIRKFKDQSIPKEDLLKLLEAATYAPSPKHQQNWHFVVLQNREIIDRMAEIVSESHAHIASMARTEKEQRQYMNLLPYYINFKGAPVTVLVYSSRYYMIEEEILRANNASEEVLEEILSPQSGAQGIGAAVQNFLLAAASMGYGTCYLTGPAHAKKEIEELIGFDKEGYNLMAMISLGIPEDKTPEQPKRKPLEEVVTFIG